MPEKESSEYGLLLRIFWMLVVQSAIGLVPAIVVWRTPTAAVWPWIGVIALCGTYSHYCLTQAFRSGDTTVVVPLDFLRIPVIAMVGVAVYGERFDPMAQQAA